ncbi:hypothetical protein CEUSTIGMA_g11362.t1 [Chlamydomonas eustigma]|uniref:Uncharacterized protein n=1 Tax=Chlamydomonas eustigma TaxID=1157962 RepID=A0A250XLI3_9CHLO|nr:hypothetical protein CEUSTIGMA_g11362.t1 [Chlamydomonas eustigma]|eukprot:GAX83938.1 hypothetical protein CEUSTIGMA_g11362.t1 [Chlamydomonas eustigma]
MPPIPDDDSCGMDCQQESHNRPSPSNTSGLYSPSALSIRSLVGKSLAAVVTNRQQYQQSSAVRRASTNIVPRSASRVMSLSRAGSSTLSSMNWIGARTQQASAAAGNPFSVGSTYSTVRALPLDIPLSGQSVSSQVAVSSSGRRVGSSKKILRQGSGNLNSSMVDAATTVSSSYNAPAGSLVLPPSILKSFQIIRDLRVHMDASGTSYLAMPTPLSRRTSRSQRPLLPSSLSTQEQQQQELLSSSANNAASLPPSPTAPSKEVRLMAASALSARAAEYAARGSARSSRLDQH